MRHAFLVAAHHQFEILAKTLEILDDDDVDFFIHVDKKSGPLPVGLLKRCCRHSEVRFIERRRVNWGGYSQIECTLSLMEEAAKNGYDYYHYISGVDLPIKPKSLILDYFQEWNGTEFIHFEDTKAKSKYIDRLNITAYFKILVYQSWHQSIDIYEELKEHLELIEPRTTILRPFSMAVIGSA